MPKHTLNEKSFKIDDKKWLLSFIHCVTPGTDRWTFDGGAVPTIAEKRYDLRRGHFGSFWWLGDTDDHGKWWTACDFLFTFHDHDWFRFAWFSRYLRRKIILPQGRFWWNMATLTGVFNGQHRVSC